VQLRATLAALTESIPALDEIYLFGSRRHGSSSFRSDIDVLVRSEQSWLGPGVASTIWKVESFLDVFAADGGAAVSLANGSRIEAASFDDLVEMLDAVKIWAHGDWCGEQRYELQAVLKDAGPTYTNVHPTYLDGAPLLVMCALRDEFRAMIERVGMTETAPEYFAEGGATIAVGTLELSTEETAVVAVSLLPRMGNVPAAMSTLDAIDSVRPNRAVLAGIAAGLRNETQLGDMVIPEVIVGYEATKLSSEGETFHGSMPETQPEIVARIKGWNGADAWVDRWTAARAEIRNGTQTLNGKVRLLFDAMASGEKVLADAERAEALTAFNRKVISVEMEAGGFSAACIRRGIPFVVIKSVSDYADATKNDVFHKYCCDSSADLVTELVSDAVL
jgi:nucleoside phosphorylase/predicted nucleotidyltransferase